MSEKPSLKLDTSTPKAATFLLRRPSKKHKDVIKQITEKRED